MTVQGIRTGRCWELCLYHSWCCYTDMVYDQTVEFFFLKNRFWFITTYLFFFFSSNFLSSVVLVTECDLLYANLHRRTKEKLQGKTFTFHIIYLFPCINNAGNNNHVVLKIRHASKTTSVN